MYLNKRKRERERGLAGLGRLQTGFSLPRTLLPTQTLVLSLTLSHTHTLSLSLSRSLSMFVCACVCVYIHISDSPPQKRRLCFEYPSGAT